MPNIEQADLPASPPDHTYSGRVVDAGWVTAQNGTMGWIVVMEVRTPRGHRGKRVAFAIKMDADRPDTFSEAVMMMQRMGIPPLAQWQGDIEKLMVGRTLSFRYSPQMRNAAGGIEPERVEVVGCLYDPHTKRGTNGKGH